MPPQGNPAGSTLTWRYVAGTNQTREAEADERP